MRNQQLKRILALVLCVVMLLPVGAVSIVATEEPPPTCEAYLTDAKIQIDGKKESSWKNAPSFKLQNVKKTYLGDGDLIEKEDLADVTVSLMWDDTRVFGDNKSMVVLVEVNDATPYTSNGTADENDSFEMWIRVKGSTKKLMIKRDGTTPQAPAWPWKEAKATTTETGWIAEYRIELNCPQIEGDNNSRPDSGNKTMAVDFIYNDATQAKGGRVACLGWCNNENTNHEIATSETMGTCSLKTTVAKGVIDYAENLTALENMTADTFEDATAFMVAHYGGSPWGELVRVQYKPLWDGTDLYVFAEILADTTPIYSNDSNNAWKNDSVHISLTIDGVTKDLRVDSNGVRNGYDSESSPKAPFSGVKALKTGADGTQVIYQIALNYNQVSGDNTSTPLAQNSIKMVFKYRDADSSTQNVRNTIKGTEYELAAKPVAEQPPVATDNTVALKGYQLSAVVNNAFNLRLAAVLTDADYEKYTCVGFDVKVSVGGNEVSKKQDIRTLYSELIGKTGSEYTTYTAENLGGKYIFALNCNNIPVDSGDVTFTVTPYYQLTTDDAGTTHAGETYSFTVDVDKLTIAEVE